jgi:hypothetical protein
LAGSAVDDPDPVLFLDARKIAVWIGIAVVTYGLSVLIGVGIARGIELALGWAA